MLLVLVNVLSSVVQSRLQKLVDLGSRKQGHFPEQGLKLGLAAFEDGGVMAKNKLARSKRIGKKKGKRGV
jgi:hypothetical protein